MKEFFRMLGELKYMIPVLRYKWPHPDSNASLAHTFQDSTENLQNVPLFSLKMKLGHTLRLTRRPIVLRGIL
jgi:hypothetical protein